MSIRAIFSECSDLLWVTVIKHLKEKYDWEPCYWISVSEVNKAIKGMFPSCVVQDVMDAIRGISPPECAGLKLEALEEDLLRKLSPYESITFNMMNRMDPTGDAFTYEERSRLYYHQIKYWLSVLEAYKPQVVVFCTIPHAVYDYILYRLCKIKGIKTIVLLLTMEGLLCTVDNFEDPIRGLLVLYQELLSQNTHTQISLSSISKDYWDRITGAYSTGVHFYVQAVADMKKKYNPATFIRQVFITSMKYIRFLYTPAPPNYLKQKGLRFEDKRMTYFTFIKLCNFKANKKKKKLQSYYNKLVSDVSLSQPYVFLPLHYQPECSTCPGGGIFTDQLLMMDIIAKALPSGWSLYVKENEWQFSPFLVGERSRTIDFYHDLAQLPNVKVVSASLSPFDLIDNSKAVATITGTAGWEAVIRGKPALVFGYAWYRGCEGVFYTPTLNSCSEALEIIKRGYRVDPEKVKIFINALEKFCFRGYFDPQFTKVVSGVSADQNAMTIAESIRNSYAQGLPGNINDLSVAGDMDYRNARLR